MPSGQSGGFPSYFQTNSTGDNFGYQGVSPEIALEEQAINRKQQIANLLLQRGMTPQEGQMIGGWYVAPSPVQGIAQLAQAGLGAYLTNRNDKSRSALSDKSNNMLPEALKKYKDAIAEKESGATPNAGAAASPLSATQSAPAEAPITESPRSDAGYQLGADDSGWAPQPAIRDLNAAPSIAAPSVDGGQPTPAPGGALAAHATIKPVSNQVRRNAIIEHLAMSTDPRAQKIGQFMLSELDHEEARGDQLAFRKEDREDTQTFRKDENDKDREVKLEGIKSQGEIRLEQMRQTHALTQMQIDSRESQGRDANDLKRQLADQSAEMKRMEFQTRKEQLQQGKVPPGYRSTADGNLEAIPGGPASTKLEGAFNQDTGILNSSTAAFDRLSEAANGLHDHPGLKSITGLRGAIPNIPGSQAADAEAKLNNLKSQVGFGMLQELRNNSKSGSSGLGALSDAEGKRLENYLAALDKAQSHEQMQSGIRDIRDFAISGKDRLRDSFNLKHKGGIPITASPAPLGTVAPFSDAEKEKRYQEFKKNHK